MATAAAKNQMDFANGALRTGLGGVLAGWTIVLEHDGPRNDTIP